VDHYTSLLELLSIPFPENVITDGVSYIPALKRKDYMREPIYSTFCHYTPATGGRPNISMRHGPWRFYKFFFDGLDRGHRYELYNLEKDIGETRNLAEEMPDKVKEMLSQLEAHAEEAAILEPQLNLDYGGNVADAWQGSEDARISVSDKVLFIESTGNAPSVETVFTPNVFDTTFLFKFEMKSNSSGQGLLFWKDQNDSDYKKYMDPDYVPTENMNVSPIAANHDGSWHQYSIEMLLVGRLKTIGLQPSAGDGVIEIRNMELTTQEGYYIRDWPLY